MSMFLFPLAFTVAVQVGQHFLSKWKTAPGLVVRTSVASPVPQNYPDVISHTARLEGERKHCSFM